MPSDGHGAGSGDMNSSLLPPMVVVVQGEKVLWGEDAFDFVWLSTLVIVLSSNPWNIRSSSEAKGWMSWDIIMLMTSSMLTSCDVINDVFIYHLTLQLILWS